MQGSICFLLAFFFREPTVAPPADENAEDNPVGKLQEHCMKNRWQPPYYETENATGLPHEKIFTIVCFVGDFTTTGYITIFLSLFNVLLFNNKYVSLI